MPVNGPMIEGADWMPSVGSDELSTTLPPTCWICSEGNTESNVVPTLRWLTRTEPATVPDSRSSKSEILNKFAPLDGELSVTLAEDLPVGFTQTVDRPFDSTRAVTTT